MLRLKFALLLALVAMACAHSQDPEPDLDGVDAPPPEPALTVEVGASGVELNGEVLLSLDAAAAASEDREVLVPLRDALRRAAAGLGSADDVEDAGGVQLLVSQDVDPNVLDAVELTIVKAGLPEPTVRRIETRENAAP